jgi:hypothetical protein
VVDVYPEHFRVRDDVRALARFQAHSLMEPPPAPGLFDVIFCRNVLVYLDAAAAKVVRAHLCAALRPGGYLFLGPLEGETPEPWLWPVSGRLDVLRRPDGAVLDLRAPTPRPLTPRPPPPVHVTARALPAPPPSLAPAPDPAAAPSLAREIEAHRAALEMVEHGELGQARATLRALRGSVPGYLPGVVDLALVYARLGHGQEAVRTMKEALQALSQVPDGELVAGPEPLPAEYYKAVAQVFLTQRRGGLP